ncbi:MAG: prepilin-type N-terminal cleavage/methylation domain-containing protein [Kiritimatiellae bacterium]|nr:prepilin-type N-terminal cleavage/methylation domain-containing protein [Kiritimatiellia bacterium]
MRRGFTILELLVASLLLGMMVTILTMVFNQSSIAWRTGVAGVSDLDDVRQHIARGCEEADNIYVWNGKVHRHLSLWNANGDLRRRAIDDSGDEQKEQTYLETAGGGIASTEPRLRDTASLVSVGSGSNGRSIKTYVVNVMSAGPDREFDTWDDIWSYPDDFE